MEDDEKREKRQRRMEGLAGRPRYGIDFSSSSNGNGQCIRLRIRSSAAKHLTIQGWNGQTEEGLLLMLIMGGLKRCIGDHIPF